jgi:CHAD domain-containing protein
MAKAADVPLTPGMTFAEAARLTVAIRSREVFEHADGVLDTSDIERVHAMRVATRRLRAVLEIFAPCFPTREHAEVLREVKLLADALGQRRDPDVQLDALAELEGTIDAGGLAVFAGRLRAEQARGNDVLSQALEHAAISGLQTKLAALAGEGEAA